MPVSQAERTTHSTPERSREATSSAVRMPSSPSGEDPGEARRLAPAKARPARSRGFSPRIGIALPPAPRRGSLALACAEASDETQWSSTK